MYKNVEFQDAMLAQTPRGLCRTILAKPFSSAKKSPAILSAQPA